MSKNTITAAQAADQVVNPENGEMLNIRYFTGSPKQYRFNGQTGRFNLDGITDIGDKLTIHPMGYRVFKDALFGRTMIEDWAEIFFVDETGCVAGIMFSNSSVTEIMNLVPRLFYAEKPLNLTDVVLDITCVKMSSDKIIEGKNTKVSWYLAKFNFTEAPAENVAVLAKFADENSIYRRDTITPGAKYITFSKSFPLGTAQLIAADHNGETEESGQVAQAA